MKQHKIFTRLCAFALAFAFLLAGCRTAPQEGENPSGSAVSGQADTETSLGEGAPLPELRVGSVKEHTGFNVLSNNGILSFMNYNGFVMAQFVDKDENGEIQPAFMQSWEILDEGKTLRFTIPTDAFFHDGVAVTAEDVKFSLEYYRDKMGKNNLKNLIEVEIISADTLEMHFSQPNAYSFLYDLNSMTTYVLPKHVWEKVDNPLEYTGEDAVIGCGPYKFVRYDEAAQTSYYEAVEDYYRGELTVKSVSLRSFGSQEAIAMALSNGEIDAVYNYSVSMDVSLMNLLKQAENVDIGQGPFPGNLYLAFGQNCVPCRDPAFRQAMSYAVNYPATVSVIGGEYGEIPGRGIIPPGNRGFDETIEKLTYDPEKARELLDEAGYLDINGDGMRENPDGSPLSVSISAYATAATSPLMTRLAEIIVQSFEEVGVAAKLDEECFSNFDLAYQKTFQTFDYDLLIGNVTQGIASYNTASSYFTRTPDGMGNGTFLDEEYVETFESLFTLTSTEEYLAAVQKLQRLNAELVPAVALCWQYGLFPYRTDTFAGGVYYPGWGMVNNKAWYTMTAKS